MMVVTERTYHGSMKVGPDAIFHFNQVQFEKYIASHIESGWTVSGRNTTDESEYVSLQHPSRDRKITYVAELS